MRNYPDGRSGFLLGRRLSFAVITVQRFIVLQSSTRLARVYHKRAILSNGNWQGRAQQRQRGCDWVLYFTFGASLHPVGATGRSPHGHQVKPAAWGKPPRKLAASLAWGSKPQAERPQGARSTLNERSIAPTACQHMWIVASGLAPDACVARKGRRYSALSFSSGWPGCLLST